MNQLDFMAENMKLIFIGLFCIAIAAGFVSAQDSDSVTIDINITQGLGISQIRIQRSDIHNLLAIIFLCQVAAFLDPAQAVGQRRVRVRDQGERLG